VKPRLKDVIKFIRLSKENKYLYLEAFTDLFLAKIMVTMIPFRFYASALGEKKNNPITTCKNTDPVIIHAVKQVICKMCNFTPWENTCLIQAIAGKRMLKRRKQQNTLYLGLMYNNADKLEAHAWLEAGKIIVTGEKNRENHTVITSFTEGNP
jgi:hypothetical protein